jgi:hypothetical protein
VTSMAFACTGLLILYASTNGLIEGVISGMRVSD